MGSASSGQAGSTITSAHRLPMMPVVTWLARWCVAGIFVYAAVVKIVDPIALAKAIDSVKILPDVLVNPTAMITS